MMFLSPRCRMGTSVALLLFLVASGTTYSRSKSQQKCDLVKENNNLGTAIERPLAAERDGNVLVIPFLISSALGMLYTGSQSKTAEEMRTALRYNNAGLSDSQVNGAFKRIIQTISEDPKDEDFDLNFYPAAFIQRGFPLLQKYVDGLQQSFNASTYEVDFQNEAVQVINRWLKPKTYNQIKKLFDIADPFTIMVLLSAANFKGTWKAEFDPKDTSKKPFYNNGSQREKKDVEMMRIVGEFRFKRLYEGSLIELPFNGGHITLIVYLPDFRKGIYESVKKITCDRAAKTIRRAPKIPVELFFPKFKVNYENDLKLTLQQLGLERMFEKSADLRGISKADRIAVLDVLHKGAIEVHEKGCKASGVVGIVTGTGRMYGRGYKVIHKAANEGNEEGSEALRATRMEGGIIKMICNHPFWISFGDNRSGRYLNGPVMQV